MSKKDKGDKGDAKPKKQKGKKGKGKGEADGDASTGAVMSVSAHPIASYQVRRIRGWAGMIGFLAVLVLSIQAGVPHFEAGLRALGGGILIHLGAWAFAVMIWKRLVVAELEAHHRAMQSEATD